MRASNELRNPINKPWGGGLLWSIKELSRSTNYNIVKTTKGGNIWKMESFDKVLRNMLRDQHLWQKGLLADIDHILKGHKN